MDDQEKTREELAQEIVYLRSRVSELEHLKEDLQRSESRFQALFENMSNAVAVYKAEQDGEDFILIGFNKAAERIEQIDRSEVLGKSVLKVFPGVRDFGLFDVFQRVWRTGRAERHPVSKYKDNRIKGWRENFVYKLPSGELVAVYSDETERKQIEESMRFERERFQMLSDSAPFGMVMIGEDGTFEYLNPKFKEILGYDLSDAPNGREWMRKIFPDSAYGPDVVSAWFKNLKEHKPGEARPAVLDVACKDGSRKTVHFRLVKLGTDEHLMTCEDITERWLREEEIRKAEAALKESEERYRAVFDNAGIGIDLLDQDGRFVHVNNALTAMLGYTDRDFLYLTLSDITHPDDREISEQRLANIMRGEISGYRIEKRYIKKDGSTMWGDLSVSAIRNPKGDHIATIGVIADITYRKEAEEKLQQEKAISDATIDSLPGTFYVFDHESKLVRWNKNLEKVTGYPRTRFLLCRLWIFSKERSKRRSVPPLKRPSPTELLPLKRTLSLKTELKPRIGSPANRSGLAKINVSWGWESISRNAGSPKIG